MSRRKQRLTVTVDPELVEAANRAVAAGEAESLSGWVSAAMSEKVQRNGKLALLCAAIADYETEFGEISTGELAAQRRADRTDAVVVRGGPSRGQPRRTTKAKSA
jgi:hypothetical protein